MDAVRHVCLAQGIFHHARLGTDPIKDGRFTVAITSLVQPADAIDAVTRFFDVVVRRIKFDRFPTQTVGP